MFVCPECGQRYERGGYCTNEGKSLAPATDPLLGSEIERYRLARVLGEGGMGRVYLAVQPAIGSRVAIKVLSDECSRNADLLERFFAEAKAVNLIRHEHIVSVLDLAVLPGGRPFIIMEFIEGHTLAHHVRNTQAPLGGVAQVMGEVLSGLAAAHHIGIVHRDLKPDNVLVTVEGHAKILDFGIAKLAPGMRADISPRTKTGALLGTPAYMAPEQISGAENSDARTDIYAAGIVLYEAVTGSVPFTGATLFDLMRAHLEHAPPPPRERRPDLPPVLEQVILQALAKDPAHRFQSATAMAGALAHATANLPPAQWKPLSTRGGSRISMPGIGGSTTERQARPSPQHTTDRDPPIDVAPTEPQAPAVQSTAVAPQSQVTGRRSNGLVIGVLAGAAIATGVALFVLAGRDKPAAPDVAAAPEPAVHATPSEPAPGPASAVAAAPVPEIAQPAQPASAANTAASSRPPAPPPPRRGNDARGTPPPPQVVAAQAAQPSTAVQPAQSSVKLGDNVQIGPGVVINGQPATPTQPAPPTPPATTAARTKVSQPADYDPKRFDPVGYLPKALALARQLAPDAKLTSFEFDPVFADGRVDLTTKGRDREYIFRSPARSALPLGHPRNVPLDRPCMIYVEVGAQQITATVRESEDCDARFVRHPKCRFAGVWKQALAAGIGNDLAARIGWLHDEQWFFDTDFAGKGGGVSSFPDRCP